MTVNRTTLLDLPLPVTGTESGTWGDTTNNGLTQYVDIAIAGMSNLTSANFTAGALTIETTEGDSSATNISATSAQYAGFRVTSLAANSTITVGNTGTSPARSYRLINADATYSLTFKATGQTGVTLLPGQSALVAFNGTDYVIVGTVGAGSTTDNTVPRFDGTTGKILQSSGITIDDSNNVSGVAQLNITTLDATNIEVTNIKAKDGTASASIADSTGVMSLVANPVLSGGTANGVLYLNGSKVATSGSALTFDGTNFVNTAGYLGTTQSGATSSYFIAKNSIATSGVVFGAHSSGAGYIDVINNNPLFFAVNDTEQMRLTSTGLKSSIAGTNADPVFSYTSDTNTGIFFPAADKLGFTAGGGTDQMVLTTTGLGIGTSSPGVKLDIFEQRPNDNTRSTFRISVESAPGNQYAARIAAAKAVGGQPYMLVMGPADNNGHLAFTTGASDTERMRLDAAGNLGLGVTPSAWSAGYKAIQNGGFSLASDGTNNDLTANRFVNSGGTSTYVANGFATMLRQESGTFKWFTAPSGTAGNAITFTQAMTLNASGNLSIGTTDAIGKLTIKETTTNFEVNTDSSGGSILTYDRGANAYKQLNLRGSQFLFSVNDVEKARITSGGDLLVGLTTPTASRTSSFRTGVSGYYCLAAEHSHVSNPLGLSILYTSSIPNGTGNLFLDCGDQTNQRAAIRSNGGLANYSANDVNLSDRREKTNFAPAKSYLDTICAIPVQTFNYIDQSPDDPGLTLGVVAQDVQAVAPELVMESNWGTEDNPKMRLSIYQTDLQYALMKCIQEQQALITSLTARVALLEGN